MKHVFTVLLSILASLAAVNTPTLGTAITTINGTDRITDSRSTINTNFSNLNSGKFELSDWYSTTSARQITAIGTITSGTWNAGVIGATYGGTGWSNIASGTIMYGKGTASIGTTTAGVDGQVLTLSGGTPKWQTGVVDQSAAYNWTGLHTFTNSSSTLGTVTTLWGTTAKFATSASTTDLTVSGTCTGCPTSYTASSTAFSVTSGTVTYTGSIPASANIGIGSYTVTTSTGGGGMSNTFIITRTGLTSATINRDLDTSTGGGYTYTLSWSGSNFAVQENTDAGTSQISGTIYWYK